MERGFSNKEKSDLPALLNVISTARTIVSSKSIEFRVNPVPVP